MKKTILICGFGPGISNAVAHKFGQEGFRVGLVARSADHLAGAVEELEARGVTAKAFPADLSNPEAVAELLPRVRAWAPLTALHYNAYPSTAPDLTTATFDELHNVTNLGVVSLLAAVQGALPDLKKHKDGAVLVTGGGFAFHDPQADHLAVAAHAMGLAVAKAAQHKIVGLLNDRLRHDGVYVGSVVVRGVVKGTSFDHGGGTIEASSVAEQFWKLYQERKEVWVSAF